VTRLSGIDGTVAPDRPSWADEALNRTTVMPDATTALTATAAPNTTTGPDPTTAPTTNQTGATTAPHTTEPA